jgi:hypothetical protein
MEKNDHPNPNQSKPQIIQGNVSIGSPGQRLVIGAKTEGRKNEYSF